MYHVVGSSRLKPCVSDTTACTRNFSVCHNSVARRRDINQRSLNVWPWRYAQAQVHGPGHGRVRAHEHARTCTCTCTCTCVHATCTCASFTWTWTWHGHVHHRWPGCMYARAPSLEPKRHPACIQHTFCRAVAASIPAHECEPVVFELRSSIHNRRHIALATPSHKIHTRRLHRRGAQRGNRHQI